MHEDFLSHILVYFQYINIFYVFSKSKFGILPVHEFFVKSESSTDPVQIGTDPVHSKKTKSNIGTFPVQGAHT